MRIPESELAPSKPAGSGAKAEGLRSASQDRLLAANVYVGMARVSEANCGPRAFKRALANATSDIDARRIIWEQLWDLALKLEGDASASAEPRRTKVNEAVNALASLCESLELQVDADPLTVEDLERIQTNALFAAYPLRSVSESAQPIIAAVTQWATQRLAICRSQGSDPSGRIPNVSTHSKEFRDRLYSMPIGPHVDHFEESFRKLMPYDQYGLQYGKLRSLTKTTNDIRDALTILGKMNTELGYYVRKEGTELASESDSKSENKSVSRSEAQRQRAEAIQKLRGLFALLLENQTPGLVNRERLEILISYFETHIVPPPMPIKRDPEPALAVPMEAPASGASDLAMKPDTASVSSGSPGSVTSSILRPAPQKSVKAKREKVIPQAVEVAAESAKQPPEPHESAVRASGILEVLDSGVDAKKKEFQAPLRKSVESISRNATSHKLLPISLASASGNESSKAVREDDPRTVALDVVYLSLGVSEGLYKHATLPLRSDLDVLIAANKGLSMGMKYLKALAEEASPDLRKRFDQTHELWRDLDNAISGAVRQRDESALVGAINSEAASKPQVKIDHNHFQAAKKMTEDFASLAVEFLQDEFSASRIREESVPAQSDVENAPSRRIQDKPETTVVPLKHEPAYRYGEFGEDMDDMIKDIVQNTE